MLAEGACARLEGVRISHAENVHVGKAKGDARKMGLCTPRRLIVVARSVSRPRNTTASRRDEDGGRDGGHEAQTGQGGGRRDGEPVCWNVD